MQTQKSLQYSLVGFGYLILIVFGIYGVKGITLQFQDSGN